MSLLSAVRPIRGPDLTCRELVADYLEGALNARERRRFEAHVAACEGCDRYVEQIRATVAATRRIARPDWMSRRA